VAPAWLPRRAYAGTYDAEWRRRRAPYLPRDFDARFLSCATPELIFDRFLAGGEPVELLGLSEQGPLRFTLPGCRPRAEIMIAGVVERPAFNLETVLIEPDDNQIALVWRAALPCDRRILKVEQVRLEAEGLERQVAARP
jgi:hypothetical protein